MDVLFVVSAHEKTWSIVGAHPSLFKFLDVVNGFIFENVFTRCPRIVSVNFIKNG
jgi:hypothetical protein